MRPAEASGSEAGSELRIDDDFDADTSPGLIVSALASPITHVSSRSAPFFLVHGSADGTVPVAQSQTFDAALHGAGAKSTFLKIDGAEHGFPIMTPQYPVASCTMLAFLKKYLAP